MDPSPPERLRPEDDLGWAARILEAEEEELLMMTWRRSSGFSSAFLGVRWNKQTGRWKATAKHKGGTHHLGYFDDDQDAARAYAARVYATDGQGSWVSLGSPLAAGELPDGCGESVCGRQGDACADEAEGLLTI